MPSVGTLTNWLQAEVPGAEIDHENDEMERIVPPSKAGMSGWRGGEGGMAAVRWHGEGVG
jgi:hypothetical protein